MTVARNGSWNPCCRLKSTAKQHPPLPIGLGPVGDIEFWKPNRGLLITAGSGSTIAPGLWAYNGLHWHELSTVCGATDGRIAWAGPEEFWTVSDGRPGQAAEARGNAAPLEDDTLCHFKGGAVVASYASPAFQASSYQPMQGAACLSALDCWFGGDALPDPQVGAFHLHWNGRTSTLEETPYIGEGRAVEDMRAFDGAIYESVRISAEDPVFEHLAEPPALHLINPLGVTPTFEDIPGLPLYSSAEFPEALDALQLSADTESLWAAAGPRGEAPPGSEPAHVTVVRYMAALGWSQVARPGSGARRSVRGRRRPLDRSRAGHGSGVGGAGGGLRSHAEPNATALVARVYAYGTVTDEQTLPSPAEVAEGVGPKGAAAQITCPAAHECWLVTTQGWLFHLTAPPGATPPGGVDTDPAFSRLITYRPPDAGLPRRVPTRHRRMTPGCPPYPRPPVPEALAPPERTS